MPNEMCESPTRKLPWPVSLHSGASKAAQTTLPAMGNEIFSNGSCDQIIGQDSSMQFYYTLLGPTKKLLVLLWWSYSQENQTLGRNYMSYYDSLTFATR